MKWYAIHNGKRIPYWLGILIGIDQAAGALIPRADLDRTISHRIGVKRLKRAIKKGRISRSDVVDFGGNIRPSKTYDPPTLRALQSTRLPFWRHPLPAAIDWCLERLDKNHCIEAIGS
jgi:hypothetical protein